jgi:hypothetical protein
MTLGRHILLSSMLIMSIFAVPVFATNRPRAEDRSQDGPRLSIDYDFDLGSGYYMPQSNLLDSVTMRRIPHGSLYRSYKGPTRLVLKLARNQVRRFARRYHDHSEDPHRLHMNISGGPVHPWWTREWFDSLPNDCGGAPDTPFIHTYGREISWKLGPLTISNTFKLKLDYVAALRLNADPEPPAVEGDPIKPPKAPSVAIDVQPDVRSISSTSIKFKVRPSISIGLPKPDEGWWSFVRKLAVRANLSIFHRGRPILDTEAELTYKPGHGLSLKIGIIIGIW